jgi:hypothetical protein
MASIVVIGKKLFLVYDSCLAEGDIVASNFSNSIFNWYLVDK